jgi:hypothetical protein
MSLTMPGLACPKCGAVNAPDDLFCAKCGTKLFDSSAPPGGHTEPMQAMRNREAQLAPMMLPGWLTLGMVLVILGGLLVLIGFMIFVVAAASLGSGTTLDSFKGSLEGFGALVGVGFFLAPVGWALHQMSLHRRGG